MWAAYQGDAISSTFSSSMALTFTKGMALVSQPCTGPSSRAIGFAFVFSRRRQGGSPRKRGLRQDTTGHGDRAQIDRRLPQSASGHWARRGRSTQATHVWPELGTYSSPCYHVCPSCSTRLHLCHFRFASLVHTAAPFAAAEFFGMHHIVTRVILDPQEHDFLQRSNYFLAIVSGSIAWVVGNGLANSHQVLPLCFQQPLLCPYPPRLQLEPFPCRLDLPGYAPLAPSALHRREIVTQLAQQGRLKVNPSASPAWLANLCALSIASSASAALHVTITTVLGSTTASGSKTTVNFCYSSEHSFWVSCNSSTSPGLLLYQRPTIQSFADSSYETCHLPFAFLCTATTFDPFLFEWRYGQHCS